MNHSNPRVVGHFANAPRAGRDGRIWPDSISTSCRQLVNLALHRAESRKAAFGPLPGKRRPTISLAMFPRDSNKLVLQCLEPFMCGNHLLKVALKDPAVLDTLRVGNLIANLHRSLERDPSFITKGYIQRLA